jgi:hypothetical protein
MNIPRYFFRHSLLAAVLAITITGTADAGINSGGGIGRAGALYSFCSIGSPFATGVRAVGSNTNRTGLIEIIVPWHTSPSVQDTDGDGMSDAWETSAGLNPNVPNGTDDPDGDGFTNYQEFVTGTLPLLPASRFVVTATLEPADFRLQCATLPNRKYRIEKSTDLSQWTLHEEVIGDGNPLNRLIPVPNGQPRGFYQIIISMYRP